MARAGEVQAPHVIARPPACGHARVTTACVIDGAEQRALCPPTAHCPDVVAEHPGSSPGQARPRSAPRRVPMHKPLAHGAYLRERAPLSIALVRGLVFPFFLTASS